ncbi:MAG TPA: B12-binding domain-containing protein [Streptosporangiaceae bacterium]|nr:B12-binding domain-containing protein [Streptosporangiaceae bacterium]
MAPCRSSAGLTVELTCAVSSRPPCAPVEACTSTDHSPAAWPPWSQRRGPAAAALDRLLADFTVESVLRQVILPYLRDLGERWARGQASVAHEHFASNVLRGRLGGLARGWATATVPGLSWRARRASNTTSGCSRSGLSCTATAGG